MNAPSRSAARYATLLVFLVIVASVSACRAPTASDGAASDAASPVVADVTSDGGATLPCNVETILVEHCQQCHSAPPQYGAPMPLVTYANLLAPAPTNHSEPVFQMVDARIHDDAAPMPQPPNPRLDATDMATIDSWVDAGAPPGSGGACAIDAGPPDAGVQLSCTPDTHLQGASAWSMPADTQDIYVCYGVTIQQTSERQVIAMAPRIDNHTIVHHALLFQADKPVSSTPAPCSSGIATDWRIVYGWAPGGQPFELPPQAGFAEGTTTNYVVQVHYNNINGLSGQTDTSGFDLCTTDQLRPNNADVLAFGTTKFTIQPHSSLDITCGVTVPPEYGGIQVIGAFPHMHELGVQIETSRYAGGSGAPINLGEQTMWNFQSQLWFPLDEPVQAGDVIKTRCAWDNTTDAPVSFGPYTEDEMCYSFTMYYPKIESTKWNWAAPALGSSCAPTPP